MVETNGKHILAEYHDCRVEVLNNLDAIQAAMLDAARAADANIVAKAFHRFSPHGVSGVVVIEESHLSIHTWPEVGYAAVDFYTCGDCVPEAAHQSLLQSLQAAYAEMIVVDRGRIERDRSMQVLSHRVDVSQSAPTADTAACFPSQKSIHKTVGS